MAEYFSLKRTGIALLIILTLMYLLSVYWGWEPDANQAVSDSVTQADLHSSTTGVPTSSSLILVTETLLDKPGGYLSNDILPPSVVMDNMPSWEFGALEMVRDLSLAMRKDFSRSQSQSLENEFLVKAQPKFNIDHRSWLIPSAESQYREGIEYLLAYRQGLKDPSLSNGQFYSRADNLRDWLKQVEKRLGSLSQRLSASVGQDRVNTDLAGDSRASQSTPSESNQVLKTSWWKLDDVFYEARGASWALIQFLKAAEVDFADVLKKKNALVSLQQIIRELEATQQPVWSPIILNGSGFGAMANHSLVMANYISRANAGLIDISELLTQG